MKKAVMEKWVKALRSRYYKRGTGRLRGYVSPSDPERISRVCRPARGGQAFCCLAVLCNIHAQEHPEIAATQTDPSQYLGEEEFLPTEVMEWAGMDSSDGMFYDEGEESPIVIPKVGKFESLASLNDSNKVGFGRIADWIEKNYRGL